MVNLGTQIRYCFYVFVAAIDGKHIRIRNPVDTHRVYYNYKKYFSIILMAVVDADYRFQYIEVAAEGRCGDAGLFNESDLMKAIESGMTLFNFDNYSFRDMFGSEKWVYLKLFN